MGRQHTIYLSESSYADIQNLMIDGESMSQVIRNALEICNANKETFDLVKYQNKKIEAYTRRVNTLESKMCNKCKRDLVA